VHSLLQVFGYAVEFDEVFDALLHLFELLGALVHLHHYGGNVTKYGCTYESFTDQIYKRIEFVSSMGQKEVKEELTAK
jgi:hypothetical protein